MSPPQGHTDRRIQQACAACGEMLPADPREAQCSRFFCCQAVTAHPGDRLPSQCWLVLNGMSDDTRAALEALPKLTTKSRGEKPETLASRQDVLMRYVREVRQGEPPLAWYRDILAQHRTVIAVSALSSLPYWTLPNLRFPSIDGIQPIDRKIERWRQRNEGEEFARLLDGYVEHLYDVMDFGFQNGQFGGDAAVKLSTMRQMAFKIGHYLDWLYEHDHRDLRDAGRMWLSRYMAEFKRRPTYGYAINKFYRWAKTTSRFVPALNFTRKHGKSARDHEAERFDVLSLDQARACYQRICEHPDPQARFLAFMSLLYSQTITATSSLRRSDLERHPESGCWVVKRGEETGFELEPEVSAALDDCLALADKHSRRQGQQELEYVLPGRNKHFVSRTVTSQKIMAAAGYKGEVLRRTGVVNMFRAGQKTMGTIVLRDQLKVSIPVIQRAIKMAGHSVNAPMDREAAEAYRKAFLDRDD